MTAAETTATEADRGLGHLMATRRRTLMAGLRSLLDRGPGALRPGTHDPSPDRAPDSLAAGVAQPLRGELEALLGADRVLARPGDLIRTPPTPRPTASSRARW